MTIYKLVSTSLSCAAGKRREIELLEDWPAVLDVNFNKWDNRIESREFASEDELLGWLESHSRERALDRRTNIQDSKNGDPDRIYAIYRCDIDCRFIYQLKYISNRFRRINPAS